MMDLSYSCHLTRSFSSWQNLYRKAGLHALPTGYRLPVDTPHFKHTKDTRYMSSYVSGLLLVEMGLKVGRRILMFINSLFSSPYSHPEVSA